MPTEYEYGEYDVLNHPDKSHSITPRARYSSEGALKAAGLGIGRLGSNAGAHLVMRPKVETQVLGVIHDYEIGDIVNRMDVLEGIDNALGFTGPPDLEFNFREDVGGAIQTLVPIGFGHRRAIGFLLGGKATVANFHDPPPRRQCERFENGKNGTVVWQDLHGHRDSSLARLQQ